MTVPVARSARTNTPSLDRGQAAVLLIGVFAVLAVVLVALGRFGRHLDDSARARTAADAAALAGVVGGRGGAAELAARNGARLVRFDVVGHDVIVTVQVDGATASARATDSA